jgi:hypothetical protein
MFRGLRNPGTLRQQHDQRARLGTRSKYSGSQAVDSIGDDRGEIAGDAETPLQAPGGSRRSARRASARGAAGCGLSPSAASSEASAAAASARIFPICGSVRFAFCAALPASLVPSRHSRMSTGISIG